MYVYRNPMDREELGQDFFLPISHLLFSPVLGRVEGMGGSIHLCAHPYMLSPLPLSNYTFPLTKEPYLSCSWSSIWLVNKNL